MTDRPLITFALFAYNQEQFIREAVEGAFAQTYEPLEIILSDDCSTDRTFEIITEMAMAYSGPHRVKVRQCAENKGFAIHINEVIKAASGEIIAWAAGDDVSLPERVEMLVKPMIDDENVIGTYSDVQEITLNGVSGKIRTRANQTLNPTIMDVIINGFSVFSQSHVFRKQVFHVFGPLRKDLSNEGPAMTFRELLLGKIIYIPTVTVLYRIGSGVSTYSGADSFKLKITEPIKITKWSLTSRLQMLDDLNSVGNTVSSQTLRTELLKQIKFYRLLLDINENRFSLIPLFKNQLIKPTDFRSLRAFIRRNSPTILWDAKVFMMRRKGTI